MTGVRVVALAADLTPERAVTALRDLTDLVFLDSSRPGGERGRYSYLTADPFLALRGRGRLIEVVSMDGCRRFEGDPLTALQTLLGKYRVPRLPNLPPFQGGAAGYFGYDLGRQLERLPCRAVDDLRLPEARVGLYDWVIAWDHQQGDVWLLAQELPAGSIVTADARIDQILRLLGTRRAGMASSFAVGKLRSNFGRATYVAAVQQAQQYIARGDSYQVNLSQRFAGDWAGDPWTLYRRLRAVSPAPYGAYLDFGDPVVLSASPECFLQYEGGKAETHPIKGTRQRGSAPTEDERLAAELRASEKDRAENLMIVDLLRNDLGKVCRFGSVEVPRLFDVQGFSHVWHLVSSVTGELMPGYDGIDLLRACFPGGSVTGCPKIRAMEIIEELEPVRRGIYCGAIGYLAFSGAMTLSIVIRTLVLTAGRLYLQVGGAVVADSDPAAEYAETLAKAASTLAAFDAEVEEA